MMAMFLAYMPPPHYGLQPMTIQGKVAELRLELNSGGKKDKNFNQKKVALKKIVANMTMSNNEMVSLFPDIISCMNIPSLEIKKLCVRLVQLQSTVSRKIKMRMGMRTKARLGTQRPRRID